MNLADKILINRKKLGLSQEELSEKLGVTRQSVSKWESDQAKPEVDKLVLMSKLFGISLDELITDVQPIVGDKSPRLVSSKKILALWFVWIVSIAVLLFVYTNQLNSMKNQNNLLSSQIDSLNSTLSITTMQMQSTIDQLKKDLRFQSGYLADYTTSEAEYNYIDESITYKVRILPKETGATLGFLIKATYSDGTTKTIETTFSEDQYYTGYVTVSKASGDASISLLISTSSGNYNQVMDPLSAFRTSAVYIDASPLFIKETNSLSFPKGNIDLQLDTHCFAEQESFKGSYSFQIVRNGAFNSVFHYDWESNGSNHVCLGIQDPMDSTSSVTIPFPKELNLSFYVGDVISLNLVRIIDDKENVTVIQTYTRTTSDTLIVDTPNIE